MNFTPIYTGTFRFQPSEKRFKFVPVYEDNNFAADIIRIITICIKRLTEYPRTQIAWPRKKKLLKDRGMNTKFNFYLSIRDQSTDST